MKRVFLLGLSATATIKRGKSNDARVIRSICPLVIGSKVPGKIAVKVLLLIY